MALDLSPAQENELRALLMTYSDIFDLDNRRLGKASGVTHRINTGDACPIHRRQYRVSHDERKIIQKEVNKMLAKDIIKSSSSPWASPVVLVKKKDGSWRFCADYRHLNAVTKRTSTPFPVLMTH